MTKLFALCRKTRADNIRPYNVLSQLRYNQRVEEIAVDCRFEQRRRTGVLRAVKNGEIR